jgi:GNAT superfamily N-acetyltransferase
MQDDRYTIRTMTRPELEFALNLATQEGWNPGLQDAECFWAADPNGFWVGLWEGQPIACISAVAYGTEFGFIGLYIVRPEFRGRGLGWQLWQRAIAYLEERNIGLDGVLAQQANYQKSGFQLVYRNIRYQGLGQGSSAIHSSIVPLSRVPFATLQAYDDRHFPAPRPAFLRAWVDQPGTLALGFVESDLLLGYGVLRPCQQGFKVAPLFANDATIAEALLVSLVSHIPERSPFVLDVPEVNLAALELAQNYHLEMVFETARMYTQGSPNLPLDHIFGITTFELG